MAGDEKALNSMSSRSRVPQGSLATSTRDACSYVGTKLNAPSGQRIETRIRYYQVNRQLARTEREGPTHNQFQQIGDTPRLLFSCFAKSKFKVCDGKTFLRGIGFR
jgi:hypothetical protein